MNYYYSDGRSKFGPFTLEELRSKINSNTLVWREGMSQWDIASNVSELKGLFVTPEPISNTQPQPVARKNRGLLIMAIIGILASLWFLIAGTYAFATHTHIDEAAPVQLLVSLYSLAFSIVVVVKTSSSR